MPDAPRVRTVATRRSLRVPEDAFTEGFNPDPQPLGPGALDWRIGTIRARWKIGTPRIIG